MKSFSSTFNSVIDSVVYDPGKVSPILLELPAEENIQLEKLDGGLFYNKRKRKNVVALQTEERIYKSSSHLSDKTTVLVVFNKTTKKVRLIHANQLELNPLSEEDVEDYGDDDNEVEETKGYEDSMNDLVTAFGSTKMKNQQKLKKALAINLDSFKDYIDQNLYEIITDEPVLSSLDADSEISRTSLPPCNEEATELKDVYRINDIIPKNILEQLYEPAKELLQRGSFSEEDFHFNKFLNMITKPKRKKKAALLIYLKTTLDWLGMEARFSVVLNMVEKKYKLPTDVAMHIIRSFSIVAKHGRLRPVSMKAKAMIYGIVLVLTMSNYSINILDYMKSCNCRLGLRKIREMCRLLRLTQDGKNRHIWTLKLPLPKEKSAMKQDNIPRSLT